ncbi:hypothetical protein NX02_p0350 (plasmid) [Sphingomonas sanxanigenens DSM 19645 = NX02]|uniref:Uncharacterized protein n=1 Tax=Sphingomonas sanxanigenens DSM 19645 = NX02 TaxID=1123269 RepID=A0A0F7JQB7_9SPHN|nr:hypothetical protein NX02_p0350 [Sphingomonas sanxanigenens DSM 19645 = NX02]
MDQARFATSLMRARLSKLFAKTHGSERLGVVEKMPGLALFPSTDKDQRFAEPARLACPGLWCSIGSPEG